MLVNMHEAKTHLSRLVDRAAAGEDIVIGRSGVPVARLVPFEDLGPRKPGIWQGKVWTADDWDSHRVNEEIAALFYEDEDPL